MNWWNWSEGGNKRGFGRGFNLVSNYFVVKTFEWVSFELLRVETLTFAKLTWIELLISISSEFYEIFREVMKV